MAALPQGGLLTGIPATLAAIPEEEEPAKLQPAGQNFVRTKEWFTAAVRPAGNIEGLNHWPRRSVDAAVAALEIQTTRAGEDGSPERIGRKGLTRALLQAAQKESLRL